MKEKKKVQYIDFINDRSRTDGSFFSRGFEVTEEQQSCFDGIKVAKRGKVSGVLDDRQVTRLQRAMRDYDISEAVVMADSNMSRVMDIVGMLFEARKYELIHNCAYIMERIHRRYPSRENAAIVIGSDKWNTKELYLILTVVKNYYKKIDIVMEYQMHNMARLVEMVYEEWGLVLHIYSVNNYHGGKRDFVMFLLKRWDGFWKARIPFWSAYLVTDEECDNMACDSGELFSGLVYKADKVLPYRLGVHMAWQKPVIYEKFQVSVIDICGI